jgi:hypothetical protein
MNKPEDSPFITASLALKPIISEKRDPNSLSFAGNHFSGCHKSRQGYKNYIEFICFCWLWCWQGIQIIGLSPRAMRARVINQVVPHERRSAQIASGANSKPMLSDPTEVIYAVQQPDGKKVNH